MVTASSRSLETMKPYFANDRLASLRRAVRGREKPVDVADAFDEQQDHIGGSILHHIVQEFAGAEIALIAGADDVAECDAKRLRAMIKRKADAAALRDDADPPPGRDQRRYARLDVDGRTEGCGDALDFTVKSFGVRAGYPHPGLFRKARDLVLHRGSIAALFGKARRYDHRVLDARGGALLERGKHRAGRNDDDGEIDRRADISNRPVAFQPIDIVVVRIDRVKLAGIVVLAQH